MRNITWVISQVVRVIFFPTKWSRKFLKMWSQIFIFPLLSRTRGYGEMNYIRQNHILNKVNANFILWNIIHKAWQLRVLRLCLIIFYDVINFCLKFPTGRNHFVGYFNLFCKCPFRIKFGLSKRNFKPNYKSYCCYN